MNYLELIPKSKKWLLMMSLIVIRSNGFVMLDGRKIMSVTWCLNMDSFIIRPKLN